MLKRKGGRITRRSIHSLYRLRLAIAAAGISVFVLALLGLSQWATRLDTLSNSPLTVNTKPNSIRVVTRFSPTTYYFESPPESAGSEEIRASGFEYELLKLFASEINKELDIVIVSSLSELFEKLEKQEVHMAAAGLSITPDRQARYAFSTPYAEIPQQVVYRVGNKRPRKAADLAGRDLIVIADSSHAASLGKLQEEHAGIQWREVPNIDYIDVLGRIESGEVDYTVIDDNEFLLHRGYFSRVKKAFTLGEPESIAWALPGAFNDSKLHQAANRFIRRIEKDGTLAKLEEQYFGQAIHISQVAANEFAKNIDRRLPMHQDSIQTVAEEFSMDWRLLAAISYQESAWKEHARSRTGVRGLMMLTLPTAKEVGVSNRLDPLQSLRGGATYLNNIKQRLSPRIVEPNRSWMALAAYNVGLGHLEDARVITEQRGGDPNSWLHVKQSLPLLTQKDWYSKTRYGYARGYEPVSYVQNIRHYYNVLVMHDVAKRPRTHIEDYSAPIRLGELDNETIEADDGAQTTLATSETGSLEASPEPVRSL